MRFVERDDARARIPHGYWHLALDSDDERVARNAAEMVYSMLEDPSERVRQAATTVWDALARLDAWEEPDAAACPARRG